ncbi:MAG: response regulator [Anaerolineae bacterium]|jgi:DNA-binding response OmpR family regulator
MIEKTILVVEDHRSLLAGIQEFLEMEGYTTHIALDGAAALEILKTVQPDLILADIRMPRLDGYALHRAVRKRPDLRSVPFIFLTAKGERNLQIPEDITDADYVSKPFNMGGLLALIRQRLGEMPG